MQGNFFLAHSLTDKFTFCQEWMYKFLFDGAYYLVSGKSSEIFHCGGAFHLDISRY
ncbi:hypothetical protein KL86CLO1_11059 [uncultured Eubacteriales bacterium]|uniref:Uncharacterized protein n=1 Tax=uncultured Eubacteriales bacterium TaxID=172733 RepID=A0A212JGM2_9FIRM|nr:hypothetical protein KL86CLO1_11059 [uncultured Eubacteriales bacterium]